MIAGFIRAKQKRKAGMSGLLLFGLLALANIAAAEPAVIELVSATAGFDQRTNEPIVEYKLSPASESCLPRRPGRTSAVSSNCAWTDRSWFRR